MSTPAHTPVIDSLQFFIDWDVERGYRPSIQTPPHCPVVNADSARVIERDRDHLSKLNAELLRSMKNLTAMIEQMGFIDENHIYAPKMLATMKQAAAAIAKATGKETP